MFLPRQPRLANEVRTRRVKWNNRQTVSPVKTNTRCGDVHFSEKRHPRREQELWQTISSAFHASTKITRFASAHNPASVRKMDAGVHTTLSCTEPTEYLPRKPLM